MLKKASELVVGDGFLCAGNSCVVTVPVQEHISMRDHTVITYTLINKMTSYAWLVVPNDTKLEIERTGVYT